MDRFEAGFDGVLVDDATGRIMWKVFVPMHEAGNQSERGSEQYVVEGIYDANTTYFVEGAPVDRPVLFEATEFTIKADGLDEAVLKLPEGTLVCQIERRADPRYPERIRDYRVAVEVDGSLEFSAAKPGTYSFDVEPPFPYQKQRVTITAK